MAQSIKRPGILRQLHGSHIVPVADLPTGDVIIGCAPKNWENANSIPHLFPSENHMQMGGIALRFCKDPSTAEQAVRAAVPVGTVIEIGIDFKDWDGNIIYSVVSRGLPSEQIGEINMPAVISIPECEMSYAIGSITVVAPAGLDTLAVGYVTAG